MAAISVWAQFSPNQNRQARIVEVRVLYNGLEASTETLGLPE